MQTLRKLGFITQTLTNPEYSVDTSQLHNKNQLKSGNIWLAEMVWSPVQGIQFVACKQDVKGSIVGNRGNREIV